MHALQHISPWTATPVHRCLEYLNRFLWIFNERETSGWRVLDHVDRDAGVNTWQLREELDVSHMTIWRVLLYPYHLQWCIILAFGLRDQGEKNGKTSQYNCYTARDLNRDPLNTKRTSAAPFAPRASHLVRLVSGTPDISAVHTARSETVVSSSGSRRNHKAYFPITYTVELGYNVIKGT
jgi:hypothetical protein